MNADERLTFIKWQFVDLPAGNWFYVRKSFMDSLWQIDPTPEEVSRFASDSGIISEFDEDNSRYKFSKAPS